MLGIRKYDWVLMTLVLLLTTFGVLMIYSADQIQTTRASGVLHYQRQLLWLLFSVISLVVVRVVNHRQQVCQTRL